MRTNDEKFLSSKSRSAIALEKVDMAGSELLYMSNLQPPVVLRFMRQFDTIISVRGGNTPRSDRPPSIEVKLTIRTLTFPRRGGIDPVELKSTLPPGCRTQLVTETKIGEAVLEAICESGTLMVTFGPTVTLLSVTFEQLTSNDVLTDTSAFSIVQLDGADVVPTAVVG